MGVLFTGTGCQVAGLYAVLGSLRDSELLVTAEVLCHGVASKMVVDAYIRSKERKYKKKIKRFCFRIKNEALGWSGGGTRMKLEFTDGTTFVADKPIDTFFLGFNKNLFLRESCYQCPYCGTKRVADFTIGDFWGVSVAHTTPEQRKLGVSLVLVNSDKAQQVLPELKNSLTMKRILPEEAIPRNRALSRPNPRPAMRDKIYRLLERKDYDRLIEWYCWKRVATYYVKAFIKGILGEHGFTRIKALLKQSRGID